MSELDLEAIKAREVRATEGPWEAYSSESTMNDRSEWRIGDRSKPQVARSVMRQADAEFIAHARQDIPALLAYIGELEDQLGAVRALVGPENESGMISADAIFHTIGTSNQGRRVMDIFEIVESDMKKLRHMLGIRFGIKKSEWGYRNYYDAGPADVPAMERLRNAGLVELVRGSYYRATRKGAERAGLRGKQLKRALGGDGD